MADNSNTTQNKNNNRNPTLRDAERETGRSGNAIHAKGVESTSGDSDSMDRGARDRISDGDRQPNPDNFN